MMTGRQLFDTLSEINATNPAALDGQLFATHGNDDNGNADLLEIEAVLPCDDLSINGIIDLMSTAEKPFPSLKTPVLVLAGPAPVQRGAGAIEPEGVYVTDTLFANWPDTDGGFRIRVLDEHGNSVEVLDMIYGDPVEQARWKEVRDLMPDDALYFQPEGAGDHDDDDVPESVRKMNSYEVYRDYDNCLAAHPEGDIMGFQFAEIENPTFLDVDEPDLYWNEDE